MEEIELKLTLLEVKAILAGLQELPGKICNPITSKIHMQLKAISDAQTANE